MGTMTIAQVAQGVDGNRRWVDVTATWSASYATGGDTIPMTSTGLKEITQILEHGNVNGRSAVLGGTKSAPLLALYANGAQATAASNQSAVSKTIRLFGA